MISSKNINPLFLMLIVIFVSAIPYISSLNNGFVDFGDPILLIQNPAVIDFSFKKAFTSVVAEDYLPLVTTSFAIEYTFFKFNPFYYHLTNLIFHILNVILVFIFVRLFFPKNTFIPLAAALLFGIHPLHVESVAWISQRKDMLCTFFSMLSLIFYFKTTENSFRKNIIFLSISVLCTALALFSKFMAITMPGLIILISLYKKEPLKNIFFKSIPYILLMIIFASFHLNLHNSALTPEFSQNRTLAEVFINIFDSLTFYISKSFNPTMLAALYEKSATAITWIDYLIMILFFTSVVTFIKIYKNYSRTIVFLLLFFLISIFPVLQIIPFGNRFLFADRFMYFPSIGIFTIFAILAFELTKIKKIKNPAYISFFLIVGLLSYKTHLQAKTWANSTELWKNTLQHYPLSAVANSNFGLELQKKGNFNEAIPFFERALELDPNFSKPFINLIEAYTQTNQPLKVRELFEKTKTLGIEEGSIYFNMGLINERENNLDQALDYYKKSIALNSSLTASYINSSIVYYRLNRKQDAIQILLDLLKLNSHSPEANNNLGSIYLELNEVEKSISYLLKAIELDPNYPEPHQTLSRAYFQKGNVELGKSELENFINIQNRVKNLPQNRRTNISEPNKN